MANVIIISVLILLICVGARRIWRTVRYGGSCCSSGSAPDKKIRVRMELFEERGLFRLHCVARKPIEGE